jgi:serpin B
MRLRIVVALALCAAAAATATADPPAKAGDDTKAVAQGNNVFACELDARLAKRDGNLFFSPYSISTALGMT